ncbi:MAG: 50S ribosomal protein L24 [Candidatus Latescibacterota bacterium]|jgi:large subunit ribosomal protein L24
MKRIHKNDRVIVLSGDDGGKEGVVLKVNTEKNQAIVQGINFVKRHQRPTKVAPTGGILEKEAPINMSNLMVICAKCNAGVKTKTVTLSDGNKIRTCKKCGEMLTGEKK